MLSRKQITRAQRFNHRFWPDGTPTGFQDPGGADYRGGPLGVRVCLLLHVCDFSIGRHALGSAVDCLLLSTLARLLHPSVYVTGCRVEVAMEASIDAKQTERVLSHLARLRHHCDQEGLDVLESLRPAWLGADVWDIVLEDLEAQHYRERARVVHLRLVGA